MAGTGKLEVIAIERAEPDGVEAVVVETAQAFAAGIILPEPRLEAVLHFLLPIPGSLGGRTIHHPLLGGGILVVHGRRAQVQGIFKEI